MPIAAIYLRHDTGETSVQRILLERLALRCGYTIGLTYADEKRQSIILDQLVVDIKSGEADYQALFVTSRTRFFHPQWRHERNIRRLIAIEAILKNAGIVVKTIYDTRFVTPEEIADEAARRQEEKKHAAEEMRFMMGNRDY